MNCHWSLLLTWTTCSLSIRNIHMWYVNLIMYARRRSNPASLKVQSNALIVDTKSIAFKMSRDFCCKARQSKSVISIILCIKYKMNINLKDFITIKQPPASSHIELEDPSWTILSSTIIVAPYIFIKLLIESKWELQQIVPLQCKLPIWLAPLPVSYSPVAIICAISIA